MDEKDWVPVEERLPVANVDVLVSIQNMEDGRHVFMSIDCILDELDGPFWGTHHRATERVLAWMPLPPRYQPEKWKTEDI